MRAVPSQKIPEPDDALTVCPVCDALYALDNSKRTSQARCFRCGFTLQTGRTDAAARTLALALSSAVLMGAVVFTPFLKLESSGFDSSVSVYDVAAAFNDPVMWPLAVSVLLFSIVLPWVRLGCFAYALLPDVMGWQAFVGAGRVLRWAMVLRPWAMAEIFMVGVAVALLKLVDLATLTLGVAFWTFASVVLLNALKDAQMCRATLWRNVERAPPGSRQRDRAASSIDPVQQAGGHAG